LESAKGQAPYKFGPIWVSAFDKGAQNRYRSISLPILGLLQAHSIAKTNTAWKRAD